MKNTGAYGYQFSQLYPPKNFQFLACSGADTTTCLANQVPLIPNNTDLITITIGGNNNDAFATVVKDCVYTITGHDCDDALKNGADTIANIAAPMATLYKAIRTAAPAARVVVLGYVQFWPAIDNEDNCQSHFLKNPDATQKTTMNTLVANMNLALKGVVSSFPGFSFVDVSPYFEGNRLCDAVETPWIQYELIDLVDRDVGHLQKRALYNEGIFHPTLEGQNVYKNALVKELAC